MKQLGHSVVNVSCEGVSPQRSIHTSGELADISSFSKSSKSSLGSSKSSLVSSIPHARKSSSGSIPLSSAAKRKQSLLLQEKTASSGSLGGATPAPSPIQTLQTSTSTHLVHDLSEADKLLGNELLPENVRQSSVTGKEADAKGDAAKEAGVPKNDGKGNEVQLQGQQSSTLTLFSESVGEDAVVKPSLKKRSSSSSSYKTGEPLFTSDKNTSSDRNISDKSNTSSILRQSASLFSTSSDNNTTFQAHDAEGFTKPSDIPLGSSRRKSSLTKVSSVQEDDKTAETTDKDKDKQEEEEKETKSRKESTKVRDERSDKPDVSEMTNTPTRTSGRSNKKELAAREEEVMEVER